MMMTTTFSFWQPQPHSGRSHVSPFQQADFISPFANHMGRPLYKLTSLPATHTDHIFDDYLLSLMANYDI